jgi:universal stress protein A
MFERIPMDNEHIFGIRAEGVLTDADYQRFLPELEAFIKQKGTISAYVDMQDFKGWEAKAAWDDLKFGLAHDLDFYRIAIIGTSRWQKWLINVSSIFFSAEMRFFPPEKTQEALEWLQKKRKTDTPETERSFQPYGHILLASDFSPHAERAGRRAVELADKYGSSISVVHVLDNMIAYNEFSEPVVIDQVALYQELEASSRQLLKKLVEELGVADRADIHLLNGSPKNEILNFAQENEVDLIVVGCHGQRGLERILGSVAAGIVKGAGCDVLTIHL